MEIYLSRLVLNPRSREAGHDLRDCAALHSRMTDLLGVGHPEGEPRALYRVENSVILLQTPDRVPDWGKLPDGYLFQSGDAFGFGLPGVESKRIDSALRSLGAGRILRFRLVLWPVASARNGKRGITSESDAAKWLLARESGRAQPGYEKPRGFQIFSVHGQPDLSVRHQLLPGGHPKHPRREQAVFVCEGRMRVVDPDAFWRTVTCGLGHGLTYGCGLLSLAAA